MHTKTSINKMLERMKSAMPSLMVGAFFIDAQNRTRNPNYSLARFLSEPQTLTMLGAAAAISLAMASLCRLFLPRDASVQADVSVDLDSSFKSNSPSTLFMQMVKSHNALKHAYKITSEKTEDFVKQVIPFLYFFSIAIMLLNFPSFIQEIYNSEKRPLFLISYLLMTPAAFIFCFVQNIIRHPEPHEPRRKECETQVNEALLYQPRI